MRPAAVRSGTWRVRLTGMGHWHSYGVAVGLLVVRDAKERETGMIVSVTQFLKLRNELPTRTDFTCKFRNELLTLQGPISIAPYCTVHVHVTCSVL